MIPVRYRASFSYLLRHPWQLALALLGIVVGVAVIVAVDLANSSARKAFLLSMDTLTGEATHQVIGGPRGVNEQVYADLRVRHGIRSLAPVIDGTLFVGEQSLQLLGVDLFAEREVREFTSQASVPAGSNGSSAQSLFEAFMSRPGVVTMSTQTARQLGLDAGDAFSVIANGQSHRASLLGTFDTSEGGLDNVILADIATAQSWLGQRGWLSRIDVKLPYGDDDALTALEAALPDGTRVLTAAGRTQATAAMSQAFMTNLTAMSLLALLVGLFLIFNSVSFSVLQRRGLIASLRALGVTRIQLLAMVLTEAAVLGAAAAVAGVVLGVWLGEKLLVLVAQSINDLYFRVTVTDVAVDTISVVKGLFAGLGAALLAAAAPAIEATTYEPRLAMMRSSLERRAGRMLPLVTVAGVATILLAVALLALSGRNLVAGLVAVFLLILGFSFCVPVAVRSASMAAAPLAQRIAGTPARLAVAGIATSLSRTGVAIVALAVAVSATIGVSVMVDSFRGSVKSWLEQTLQADIYAGVARGTMLPELIDDIGNIDGVVSVSTSRRVWLEDALSRTQLLVVRMAPGSYAGTDILDLDPGPVWDAWENGDAVLVSEPYAYQNAVSPGDSVTLPTDAGERPFHVAATFRSYDINASAIMMSRSRYDRFFDDDGIDSLGLYLDAAADVEATIARIRSLSNGRQELRIESNVRIRDLSLQIFDRTFVITDVLYWLASGVAFIGILSAMLALQLERAREFALLRALGMTPRQVGAMITTQTGVIGLISGLAAIPLGLAMSWVLIKVINRRAFGWQIDMDIAPAILLTGAAFAVGASLLAGLYPGYRAAMSRPAIAMREE
ncbi:MAG: FtsX-like permease family protein [Woeseiaceae bacterium]|nr:FtsX-like permease family protein [Woeseiaceae bacterium]